MIWAITLYVAKDGGKHGMCCKDTWKRHIPPEKLAAYKQLLDDGLITNPHVTYVRSDQSTIVEYDSGRPHEWILNELRNRSEKR